MFDNKKIFGMIHLAKGAGGDVVKRALYEIEIYQKGGVDGIIVENYHGSIDDVAKVLWDVDTDEILTGVNILPNDFEKAIELADKYDADFIQLDWVAGAYNRCNPFDIENYSKIRKQIPYIKVMGGVWPKYYEPIKDSNLENDINSAKERCDAIVVTGAGTGKQTPIEKIEEFKTICDGHPLIIGAGLNPSNVAEQLALADGAIVGSCFKQFKRTSSPVELSLV